MSIKKCFTARDILYGILKVFVLCFFLICLHQNVWAADASAYWPVGGNGGTWSGGSDWPTYSNGNYHSGTDISAPAGTPVYASYEGVIDTKKSMTTSYGNHIIIKSTVRGETVYIYYCHMSSFANVSVGNSVSAGQLIGYVGSTGNSTGNHLHYEVRNANKYYGNSSSPTLNPCNYLPSGPGAKPVLPDACSCSTSYAGKYTVSTDSQPLAMRSGHGTGYSVVTYIPKGSQVSVSKSDGTWAHVEWNGQSGFCSMQYLTKEKTNDIQAYVDEVSGGVNSVKIAGWVFDRIDLSRAVEVHIYIGGEAHAVIANQPNKSVDDAFGCGEYHGFSVEIPTNKTGEQQVAIYAITPETGINPGICEPKTVNIISDHEKPVISNVTVSNVSSQGYTVTCEVTDNVGIKKVQFPTWTEYGEQDDIIPGWPEAPEASGTIDGNKVSYRVNTSAHNNETGTYFTHIYAYDKGNNVAIDSVKVVLDNGLTPVAVSSFNGHIYAAFKEAYSWKEAEALCESMGGHLATITSKEENDFINHMSESCPQSYIGLSDEETEGVWKWVTGEKFSYSNWAKGQPDNANEEDFGMFYPGIGDWNDAFGEKSFYTGFILEIDDMGAPVSTSAENGSVYEMYDVTLPWEVAEKYCEMKGGTLVCITSEKEEKIIEDMIGKGTKRIYQFGATDKETEGVWKWATGESMSYSYWAEGENNNRSGDGVPGPENYLVSVRGRNWYDMKSFPGNSGFILEKKADLAVSGKANKDNVKKGDKVTVSAAASGGSGSYTYSYLLHNKDTNQWSRLTSSFLNNNSYTWTAGSAGNHEFFVEVKDAGGTVVRSSAIPVKVMEDALSITGRISTSAAAVGSKATISGTAAGGSGNYTYSYLLHNKDTNQWSRLTSSFISNNSYTWTAGSAGNREFFIEAKDSAGTVVRSSALNIKVSKPLSITGKTNVSETNVGNKVIISGTAAGGSGNYTYSYLVHNKDTNQWSRLTSSFISNNSYTWTAGSAGNREFFVEAKDSAGTVVRSNAVNVNTIDSSRLKIDGKANISSVVAGNKVIISGTASGGNGNYTYSYLVHNKDTNQWSRLTPSFISSNSYTWTAGSAGNREFFVEVKDSTGKVVRSNAVNVKTEKQSVPLGVSAGATTSQVSVGEKVVILGAGNGGNGDYTYSYLVHNKDTNQWSRLTPSFITNNTYTWTAGSAGNREFFVEVKDSTGKVVRSSAVNVLTK